MSCNGYDNASSCAYGGEDTVSTVEPTEENRVILTELATATQERKNLQKLLKNMRRDPSFRLKKEQEIVRQLQLQLDNMHAHEQTERKTLGSDEAARPTIEYQLSDLRETTAKMMADLMKGKKGGEQASAGMSKALDEILASPAISKLSSQVRDEQILAYQKKADKVHVTGTSCRSVYECAEEKINQQYPEDKAKAAVLKALFYMVSTAIGVNEAAEQGIIDPTDVDCLVKGALMSIEEVTGFIWAVFEKTVQSPVFWGGIITSFVGLLITVAGGMMAGGTIAHYSKKYSSAK